MTQVEFAKALDVSPRTVQNWEAGKKYGGTEPKLRHIPKIERLAHLPPGWILYDGEEWENEERRRLPPGSGLVGILAVVGALVLPGPANAINVAAGMCSGCAPIRDSRQPRMKLARAGRGRTISPVGGVIPPDNG